MVIHPVLQLGQRSRPMHRGCYICEKDLSLGEFVEVTECGEIVCYPCTTDPNDITIKEEGDSITYIVNR